jgi:hypothetical protein
MIIPSTITSKFALIEVPKNRVPEESSTLGGGVDTVLSALASSAETYHS